MCLPTAREQPGMEGLKAPLAGRNKAFRQPARGGWRRCDPQGLREFLQMLLEHFLALGQSAGSNEEHHLEHIWTLTPTQEKD